MDCILLLSASKTLLNKLKKQLMDRLEMSDAGDVSNVVGMNVTCDREKGAITTSQKNYRENVVQLYGMEGCNLAYIPKVGPKLSLNQPENKLMNEEEKRHYLVITGAVIKLAQGHPLQHPLRGQPAGEGQ